MDQLEEVEGFIFLFWLLCCLAHLKVEQGFNGPGRKRSWDSLAVTALPAEVGLMGAGVWASSVICRDGEGVSVVFGHSLVFGYVFRAVSVEAGGSVTVEHCSAVWGSEVIVFRGVSPQRSIWCRFKWCEGLLVRAGGGGGGPDGGVLSGRSVPGGPSHLRDGLIAPWLSSRFLAFVRHLAGNNN